MSTTAHERLGERLRSVVEAARWAPSVHNTQPWRFRLLPDGLEIREDETRALPVLDPAGRLRLLSCGAAALNAAVAMAALERRPVLRLLPDPDAPTVLATVTAGPEYHPSAGELADAWAVTRRRTHRRVHRAKPVDPQVLRDLEHAVRAEGARLTVADPAGRREVARLLAAAARDQAGRPELVQEVESWVRHWGPGEQPVDGIPVGSLGTAPYPVDSLVQEQTEPGAIREAEVAESLAGQPLVAISTSGDGRRDWLVAGAAMQRMLLRATSAGLVAAYADQATQHEPTRARLADALDLPGHPQIVLRLGHPLVDVPDTPRRPLADLLA